MIGFYDYTVVLTYLGLMCGLYGCTQALQGNFLAAIFCTAGALFCDTMDGRVARAKPNRTRSEQMFGIQIDSLCDVISFGIFPAVLFYSLGLDSSLDLLLLAFYCLCCVIRLGYFNILAAEADPTVKGDYHGLPVVCLSVMIPAAYMMGIWLPDVLFRAMLRLLLVVFGALYVLDFPVRKPTAWKFVAMGIVFFVPLAVILVKG